MRRMDRLMYNKRGYRGRLGKCNGKMCLDSNPWGNLNLSHRSIWGNESRDRSAHSSVRVMLCV